MMALVDEKLAKLIRNEQRGLISPREAAVDVLLMLAADESSEGIYEHLTLPIKTEVDARLCEIAIENIQLRPLMIGQPLSEVEIGRINRRLSQFYKSLNP
jgi:hypothetical protein